jgi:hypothetical protein
MMEARTATISTMLDSCLASGAELLSGVAGALAVQSSMGCAHCRGLEAELVRLGHIHTEKVRIREAATWQHDYRGEFSLIRSVESDALLALEITRAEVTRHKRNDHKYT